MRLDEIQEAAVMPLLQEHRPNKYVRGKVESLVGPMEPLLATVKRWKLMWFDHVTRHYSLCRLSSRAPSIAFVGEGDNVRAGSTTPYNG